MTNLELSKKTCSCCGKSKNRSCFSMHKKAKDGLQSRCKECQSASFKEWSKDNRERRRKIQRDWYEANIEHAKEQRRVRDCNNREHLREVQKKWYHDNPDKIKKYTTDKYIKLRSTPAGKLKLNTKGAISASLKKGSKARRSWETLVGYTIEQLREHLEKKFTPEMNWENYGSYWHIDHIVPIAAFNFERPEDLDFTRCWALKNLRPLEAIQNLSKGDKVDKPIQPSLLLAVA